MPVSWSTWTWAIYNLCRASGFICFFAFGITCVQWAQAISNDYPELQYPPHPPNLLVSLQITTVIGCVGMVWGFLCFFILALSIGPCFSSWRRRSNFPYVLSVLVDSIIAVGLTIAVKLQAELLLKPVGQCEDIHQIISLREGSGPSTSLVLCKSFSMVFTTQIVLAFVSGVAAIVVVWLLVSNNTLWRWVWLAKWVRYCRRRTQRMVRERLLREKKKREGKKRDECDKAEAGFAGGIWTRTTAPDNNTASEKNEPPSPSPSPSPPSPGELYLSRLLCTYATSQPLVSTLHTTDILSLSLASPLLNQSLRTTFTPQNLSLQTCLPPSSSSSCYPTTKSTCYSCSIQLCHTCTHLRTLNPSAPPFHTTICKPYCASCYRNTICTAGPGSIYGWETKVCKCMTISQDGQKFLCRLCYADTDQVVILRAEKRQEVKEWRAMFAGVDTTAGVEMGKKRERGGGDKGLWCWGCKRYMRKTSDRVWWGCPRCKGECLNLEHYEK